VRFVVYATHAAWAGQLEQWPVRALFGDAVTLVDSALPGRSLVAGELLPVSFTWQAQASGDLALKVFVQLLDGANHIVGQRDAPLMALAVGQTAVDRHAVLIEPGTPPGSYRLIVGLYDAVTGQRLPVAGGDHVELGEIRIERPAVPLAPAAIRATYPADRTLGPLKLLGYERHALGAADKADPSLARGTPLHVALYWQR